ncbi:MAG: RNA polymerase sigma factor, partial [Chthoniobacterales bacterium]
QFSIVNGSPCADAKGERTEADKALLREWLSGGEAAFSLLYRRLSPPLFAMVFEILKHQNDAEDVLQETFVQMWKKAPTFDPQRGSVFTWAVVIARSKAIDRYRARQRRDAASKAAIAEGEILQPEGVAAADDFLSQRDERERVRAVLHGIPDAQRAVIHLAFFSGLTHADISKKLGAPLGTIKARIRRGLLALRDSLTARQEIPALNSRQLS